MRPWRVLVLLPVLALFSLVLAPAATARDSVDSGCYEQADRDQWDRDVEARGFDAARDREWTREERGVADDVPLDDPGWDDPAEGAPGEDWDAPADDPTSGGLPGGDWDSGGDPASGGLPGGDWESGDDPASGGLPGGDWHSGDGPAFGAHEGESASQDAEVDDSPSPDMEPSDPDPGSGDPDPQEAGCEPQGDDGIPLGEDGDRADGSPDAPNWDPTGDGCDVAIDVGGDDDAWDGPTGDLIPMLNWTLYWLTLLLSGNITP